MSRENLKPRLKMKYRHIMSGVLSAVLLVGGFQPVLAENTTSGSNEFSYTVGESYTWTAPATINFTSNSNGSEAKTATINVTENPIGYGKILKIGIASDQTFELVDSAMASNKRTYTVKDGSTALSAGSEVLAVDAGTNTAVKNLTIQMNNVATEIAGSYSGTLRFVSTIENSGTSIIDGTNVMLSNDVNGNGWPDKGDTITFAREYLYSGSNTGPTEFLVLKSDGSTAELMAKTSYITDTIFKLRSGGATDSAGNDVLQYEGSKLDTLLNDTYYNTLSNTVKGKIQPKSITQNSWKHNGLTTEASSWYKLNFDSSTSSGTNYTLSKVGTVGTYSRNVYALDVQDIIDYLGTRFTPQQLNKMFFDISSAYNETLWLRSAHSTTKIGAFIIVGNMGQVDTGNHLGTFAARPAFTITLN